MKKLYPLKFKPILKERVWGGKSLIEKYKREVSSDEEGNPILDDSLIGESWDVVAMDDNISEVVNGYLAENDLADILETYMGELMGDEIFDYYNLQFPLLMKILDVEGRFSVQAHPDDKTAFERFYCYGKSEYWYVMEASEDAEIYMGFRKDTDATELFNACKAGTAQNLLNVYRPKKGDCFFVKPGTVHAAKGKIIIAEVQESSDITFRLYDWGRENNPATARPMHLEEAMDCIDYNRYDEENLFHSRPEGKCRLVECDQFVIDSLELNKPERIDVESFNSLVLLTCVEGSMSVRYRLDGSEAEPITLQCSETVLVPASMDEVTIVPESPQTMVLQIFLPQRKDNDDYLG